MTDQKLAGIIQKWSEFAIDNRWVENWVEGAIFPREMVFFIATCEYMGIKSVIESGRQDGYSTAFLGEYGQRHDAQIFSIDWEEDKDRARKCHKRLSVYDSVHCLKGDASQLLGQLVREQQGAPTAIICDGPKNFFAMSLMFASVHLESVQLLALHNLIEKPRKFFRSQTEQPCFYEQFDFANSDAWQILGQNEVVHAAEEKTNRSLEESSLGVMRVDDSTRSRLLTAASPDFGVAQPSRVRWAWKLGLYQPASLLFSLPQRIEGIKGRLNSRLSRRAA